MTTRAYAVTSIVDGSIIAKIGGHYIRVLTTSAPGRSRQAHVGTFHRRHCCLRALLCAAAVLEGMWDIPPPCTHTSALGPNSSCNPKS